MKNIGPAWYLSCFLSKIDEKYCILLTQYYRVSNSGISHFSHFNIRCYLYMDESDVKPMLNVWNYERNSERHQICWPSIHSWINTQVCCATVTIFTKLTSTHHWCIHARLKVITILLFESKKTRKTCERWNGRLPRRMRRRKAARCVHAESWKAVSTLNCAFHPTPVSRRSTEECMTADRKLAAQVILRSFATFYLKANTFSDQRTFPGSNDRCMIIPAAWCNRGMFQMTWPRCAWKSVSFKEASARQGESSNCTTAEHVGTRPDRVGGRARERLQSRNLWSSTEQVESTTGESWIVWSGCNCSYFLLQGKRWSTSAKWDPAMFSIFPDFGARQITWPCYTKIRDNLGMTTSSDLLWSQLLCNSNATSFAIISEFGSEALVVGIFWLNSDVYCFATWKIHYFANILGVSTCTFTPKNVIASKGFMLIQICLGPWRYYGGKILKKHAAPEPGMLSRL